MPHVFVSTPAVFGERPSTWGRTLPPIRPMPYSFGGASLSAPTAALRDRRDALEEARAAPSGEGDALREPRDAFAIRGDAVRTRGRDSRRVARSSRSSPPARAISEAAVQTRGAALPTQGDASRASRNAVDTIRDAQRGEDDTHDDAQKPVPTSTESSTLAPGPADLRGPRTNQPAERIHCDRALATKNSSSTTRIRPRDTNGSWIPRLSHPRNAS